MCVNTRNGFTDGRIHTFVQKVHGEREGVDLDGVNAFPWLQCEWLEEKQYLAAQLNLT